jgi:hypothetical protein
MKRLVLAAALLLSHSAFAQPPEIVQPEDQIELAVGEARTLKFHETFQKVGTVTEGVAQIMPQSDRTLTVSGLAPGQTLMFVHSEKGDLIYTAAIAVTPTSGHLVKHYGRRGVKDFVGYYCSETGCGRADLDKKLANSGRDPDEPTAQSVTVTRPTGDGGAVSTTNQYRQ